MMLSYDAAADVWYAVAPQGTAQEWNDLDLATLNSADEHDAESLKHAFDLLESGAFDYALLHGRI